MHFRGRYWCGSEPAGGQAWDCTVRPGTGVAFWQFIALSGFCNICGRDDRGCPATIGRTLFRQRIVPDEQNNASGMQCGYGSLEWCRSHHNGSPFQTCRDRNRHHCRLHIPWRGILHKMAAGAMSGHWTGNPLPGGKSGPDAARPFQNRGACCCGHKCLCLWNRCYWSGQAMVNRWNVWSGYCRRRWRVVESSI